MNEILIGTAITLVIAVAAGAYRLGADRARRNGNGSRQFVTKEFCGLQHKNLDEALREIKANTAHIPEMCRHLERNFGRTYTAERGLVRRQDRLLARTRFLEYQG